MDIREFMFEHGLTMDKLCIYLGFSESHMSRVLNCKVKTSKRLQYRIEKIMREYPDIKKKEDEKNASTTVPSEIWD